jgi:DNA-binding protein YbaB
MVDRNEVEQLRAQAERLRGQVERVTGAFHSIIDRFNSLEAMATSADGLVTAVVGADGRLRRLELDPGIYLHPDADELARTIEETIELAASSALEKAQQTLEPYVPANLLDARARRVPDAFIENLSGLLRGQ